MIRAVKPGLVGFHFTYAFNFWPLTMFNMRVCYCNSIYRKKIKKGIIGPLSWFTANKVKGIIIKCGEALLTVWLVFFSLSSMTDVIRRTGSIKGKRSASERGSRIAARPSSAPQVLHGAQISDVQLTELTSGETLYKLGNPTFKVISLCSRSPVSMETIRLV